MLVVELKTPAFGLLGLLGIGLIVLAVFGHTVAGLAGFEAILLLIGGVVLLGIELFVLPGTLIFGITGVLCILGAMVWSMADIWPVVPEPGQNPVDWKINTDSITKGVTDVALGMILAIAGIWAIWRFLPKSPFYKSLVHQDQSGDPSEVVIGGGRYVEEKSLPDIGSEGKVLTDLHPLGMVEVDGNRYEATTSVGDLAKGDKIIVVGYKSYSLLVEKKD